MQILAAAGQDVLHMRAHLAPSATDHEVMALALAQGRCVVSMDSDFGTLLASSGASAPSFLLFRTTLRSTEYLAATLLENLPQIEADLLRGSVVVVGDDRIRIRHLPL